MSVKSYPKVLSEDKTLELIVSGRSIARYGDGEFKMADHLAGIKSQNPDQRLTDRLAAILHDSGDCLVGIPNIRDVIARHTDDDKIRHWTRYLEFKSLLAPREYVSSFITRPDSAPWINTAEYWAKVESLWQGRDVCVVRGSGKSLTTADLNGARTVTEILCPRNSAFSEYDSILDRILSVRPKRVLIGLGPTATLLAVDLCAKGIHAIDLGHLAMFLRKFRKGEPPIVTDEDKAVDRVPA
jgi:hypothetical protein